MSEALTELQELQKTRQKIKLTSSVAEIQAYLHKPSNMIEEPLYDEDIFNGSVEGFVRGEQMPLAEREKQNQDFWKRTFKEEEIDLQDVLPYRVKCCWRIVREMSRLKGLVSCEQTMIAAIDPTSNPWNENFFDKEKAVPVKKGATRLTYEVMLMLENIPLLPPPIPEKWLNNPDYDPENVTHDPILHLYVECLNIIVHYLKIDLGSLDDPNLGRYGLHGVLDHRLIRLVFPSRFQLMGFEEALVRETLQQLINSVELKTKIWLRKKFGLSDRETKDVISMARSAAKERLDNDVENERGLMVLKIEDYMERSKENLDMRAEMNGLKLLSSVLGLTKAEPDEKYRDFMGLVKKVSSEQKVIDVTPE